MWRHIDEKCPEYHGRLLKRISELEAQVAYEQERNLLNVAQHTDRIKELEADNKRLKETLDDAMTIITNAVSAFPSISAQAWLDKQEGE
jgi:hypothetical protein